MKSNKIIRLDEPGYTIDHSVHVRFDQRHNIFGRMLYDKTAPFYKKDMYENVTKIISQQKEGYSRISFAHALAGWTVHDYFHGAFSWERLQAPNSIMSKPSLRKYEISDKKTMSRHIKQAARIYGAAQVGICRLNKQWLYARDMDGNVVDIPEEFHTAVVMTIAMDEKNIAMSPAFAASAETALGYSRMAFCIACLAEFIRNLGYQAIPTGNDTGLSVPLAVDAGLGELGRLGLLITPEFGPCVRLCKVFTDMPLIPDKPICFGVTEFCKQCNKCADACEAGAIQTEKEPSFDMICPSNNKGILRWSVNHDKCYQFWVDNGGDCSNCISACPFDRRKSGITQDEKEA
ncbi:MAG: reductive dehalogenase [bacterium]